MGSPTPFFEELPRGCLVTVTCRGREGPGGQRRTSSGKAECRQAACRTEMGIHTAAAGLGIARLSKPAESVRLCFHAGPSPCLISPPPRSGWCWTGREKPGIPPPERVRNALAGAPCRVAPASMNTRSLQLPPLPGRGRCSCPLCPRTHRQAHPGSSSRLGAPPGLRRRPEGA